MGIVICVIVISFFIHIYCYTRISKNDGSFLNVFFPYYISNIPINFVFEPLYIFYYGLYGSVFSYCFIYCCYTFIVVFMTIGYLIVNKKLVIKLPFSKVRPFSAFIGLTMIGISILVYLPVLIEFREFIFNPREIYIHTRTGYGLYFFLSTFLALIGFIITIFSKRFNLLKICLLCIFIIIFLYLHGSKGQVTLLVSIVSLYYVYLKNWSVGFKSIGLIIGTISAAVMLLFYLTTSSDYDNIFKLMIGYSDYNRNAMIVIDKQQNFYNGQITFESNFYSRIPRAIMPDKPKDYGVFKLAKTYFREWFYDDTGSPAFGLGVQYADFGIWSIFYLSFWGLITGVLMKIFVKRLKYYRSPGDFIVVLFLAGVVLIPTGDGYLLPEHLFIAVLVNVLLIFRFKKATSNNRDFVNHIHDPEYDGNN